MTRGKLTEQRLRDCWLRHGRSATHRTPDGGTVTVLDPGTPNPDGGPDFHNALVRIGTCLYRGDVEIHLDGASWQKHGHHRDPHYNRVVLHVVLAQPNGLPPPETSSGRPIPVAIVEPDSLPLEAGPSGPSARNCAECLSQFPPEVLHQVLRRLATERLGRKMARLGERLDQIILQRSVVLREPAPPFDPSFPPAADRTPSLRDRSDPAAWDQLLYEGISEALGFEKNRRPFLQLAQSVPISLLRRVGLENTTAVQGILFGAAGLLPSSRGLPEKQSRVLVRILRRRWKEWRHAVSGPLLHEGNWLFFRLRPANFPTARIAALSFLLPLLFRDHVMRTLVGALRTPQPRFSWRTVRDLFTIHPDPYWRSHLHFRSPAGSSGVSIGHARIAEIAVNVLVPAILFAGRLFHDADLSRRAFFLLDRIPAPPPNRLVRAVYPWMPSSIRGSSSVIHLGIVELAARTVGRSQTGQCPVNPGGECRHAVRTPESLWR